MNTAILLAAGSGTRMQEAVADKLLAPLSGQPVIAYSISAFIESGIFEKCILVYRDEAQKAALATAIGLLSKRIEIDWVQGGAERQDSVLKALQAAAGSDYVFIHDGARPLITPEALKALARAVQQDQAAVLAHPVNDTIKRISDPARTSKIDLEDLDRSRLWAMETPQAFEYHSILKAYQNVSAKQLEITDDAAALATIGLPVSLVQNQQPNPKITTPEDLILAEHLLNLSKKSAPKEST
jgi:2-C-methyl-D-erythritol 4-phosphate cytidylyltransferase